MRLTVGVMSTLAGVALSILCSLAGQRCAETLYQICRKQNRTGAAKDGHMHAWPYSRLGDPGSVVDNAPLDQVDKLPRLQ